MASEFALIDAFVHAFASVAGNAAVGAADDDVLVLGPADDAALVRVPEGELLVATTDTLVLGRHFLPDMPAACVGWRALAVNLSDLAAMGARPLAVLVSFTLPQGNAAWLRECGKGMAELARRHAVRLAGGNLSKGELAIGITALGSVPPHAALRRRGARVGDAVYVSGRIGSGAAGLRQAQQLHANAWPGLELLLAALDGDDALAGLARYAVPRPRCELGVALRGVASACIDISDGLLADLGHLCAQSGVSAHIDTPQVPIAAGVTAHEALRAGDDYELCFTVETAATAGAEARLAALAGTGFALTRIGTIEAGKGVWLDGVRVVDDGGYLHFS